MPTLHEEKGRGEERESTAGIKLSIASHGRQTQSSWENKQSLELCSFHLQAECKLPGGRVFRLKLFAQTSNSHPHICILCSP